jgi:hypothetical protein
VAAGYISLGIEDVPATMMMMPASRRNLPRDMAKLSLFP